MSAPADQLRVTIESTGSDAIIFAVPAAAVGMLVSIAGPDRTDRYIIGPHGCDEVECPAEDVPFYLMTVGMDLDAVARRAPDEKRAEPPIANTKDVNQHGRRVGLIPLPADDEDHLANVAELLGSWGVKPEDIHWVPGEMPRRLIARFDNGYWHGCPIDEAKGALRVRVVQRGEPASTGEIAWLRMQRDPLVDPSRNKGGGWIEESDWSEIRRLTRRILALEAMEAAKASGEWYGFVDPASVSRQAVAEFYEIVEERDGESDVLRSRVALDDAIAGCLDWAEDAGYIPGTESREELEARLREDKCYTDGDITVTIRRMEG